MSFIFSKNPIEIQSQKSDKIYNLVRADSVPLGENAIAQITEVCNESNIYENVFSTIFKGARYSENNARTFIKLVSEGWVNGTRFDWLILYDKDIVGTIGIKSLEGEIGYWQSDKHPGVMTNVVRSVCSQAKLAGFSSLWAYVKPENGASVKVLQSAGFVVDADLTAQRGDAVAYRNVF